MQDLRDKLLPSSGRAPTPPEESSVVSKITSSPYFGLSNTQDMKHGSRGSSAAKKTPMKSGNSTANITGKRPNQSILNFFGKQVEKTPDNDKGVDDSDSLFFEERKPSQAAHGSNEPKATNYGLGRSRFNESQSPVKRRRLDDDGDDDRVRTPSPDRRSRSVETIVPQQVASGGVKPSVTQKAVRHIGGFVDDSSSDEGDGEPKALPERCARSLSATGAVNIHSGTSPQLDYSLDELKPVTEGYDSESFANVALTEEKGDDKTTKGRVYEEENPHSKVDPAIPTLTREATSAFALDEFDEMGDFEDDEFFEEGEEMQERRWMEEQRMLEMELDEDSKSESAEDDVNTPMDDSGPISTSGDQSDEATCPICNANLRGSSEAQASTHVNACLDGNPLPVLTKQSLPDDEVSKDTLSAKSTPKRFQRAAIARPGQQNPFSLSRDGNATGSAFSRLMSGHAEDAAWAEAASNEARSRGKPAAQRTCPFYKIMPGLYICVDAFRYGKVEGQSAYFLSHFHSDHYIGLTSSWCHGPIYCSKVTANLVRQQLRVDPKWVVPLEFEKKVEVPNTKGVHVTMLPANHCPGSSLYLFEKVVSKNPKGATKLNRVLHCGDFRACPAHVNHPLLKPEVVDAISGQTKQQVIDTCYLDTTYLTPKYAFPPQSDVIDACAQMCVSLSREIVDTTDTWEKAKLERAGSTMTKFLEKPTVDVALGKPEEEDQKPTTRGRLLVVIGTYSIGKERICLGIAKALNSKIFAPPAKMRICKCLEDAELNSLLTTNPHEAQVHMQTLMEIRAETLHDYLVTYRGSFSRVVGFRPTGWNYRPPASRFTENPAVNTVLTSESWNSRFTMKDLVPGRGSTRESNCFGVPYSEHSSFRELSMFCCALRIGRVIPTVNVGSAKSREKMKGWIEKWDAEKKKNGLFKVETGADGWGSGDGQLRYGV